jgi:hypothetical protein
MKIENNIPMPVTSKSSPYRKYPFAEMKVGDSVFFADEPKGTQSNPSVASRMYSAHSRKKFSSRKKPDGGSKFTSRKEGTGVRIWRIA